VLKNDINIWLRQHQEVQAFCSTAQKDGGAGAVFVLLRLSDKYGDQDDGLLLGLTRENAAKFSFLLSIPVIALAGSLKALELYQSDVAVSWDFMSIGAVASAVVAYLSISWFLRLLNKIGMMPFVWYRLNRIHQSNLSSLFFSAFFCPP
jgi:hypothetical protein